MNETSADSRDRATLALELLMPFAERTGLTSRLEPRRYLWTDTFAVASSSSSANGSTSRSGESCRDGWHVTALFSNTALAHQLGTTLDWLVLYCERDGHEDQCTIVTERRGPLAGRRVVRGREGECQVHYREQASGNTERAVSIPVEEATRGDDTNTK